MPKFKEKVELPVVQGESTATKIKTRLSLCLSVEDHPSRIPLQSEVQFLLAPPRPPKASLLKLAPGSAVLELLGTFIGRAAAT